MEKILLAAFLLCEIAFFILSMRSEVRKNDWARERMVLHGLELIVFIILLLTPLISLDLRFKLIFVVLIIRDLVSVIRYTISRKKTERKATPAKVVNLVVNMLILTVAIAPAFLFTDYSGLPVSGSYEVAQTQFIIIDENRDDPFEGKGSNREIPVYAFYPKDGITEQNPEAEQDAEAVRASVTEQNAETAGQYPLVVFSHGAFGYYQSNMSSYQELASNGYVVLALDHPHHSFVTKNSSGKTITVDPDFIKNVMYVNEIEDEEEIFRLSSEWVDVRIKDINEVLDEFGAAKESESVPENWWTGDADKNEIQKVLSMADTKKIGLYGHSLGGAASVTTGRNRSDVHAVIDLDGTMLGEQLGYENGEYQYNEEPYPTPLLTIESELHHDHRKELGILYVNQYICDHAVDARSVYFKGTGHMNFTDLPLFSPFLASMLQTGTIDAESCIVQMNDIIRAFFDYNLKEEGDLSLQEYYQ